VTGKRRIIGIDYGTVRIGVAISDPLNIVARTLRVVPNGPDAIGEIAAEVARFDVGLVVVGFPVSLDGGRGTLAAEVEEFSAGLAAAAGVPVEHVDESFTSEMAKRSLIEAGVPRKKRREKGAVDAVASALILQHYLDTLQ
jgi:putative Holliday junction resolvase